MLYYKYITMNIMKYITTTILVAALLLLPTNTFATPDPHTNITPPAEYVASEIAAFRNYAQADDRTMSELRSALSDLEQLLVIYNGILDRDGE